MHNVLGKQYFINYCDKSIVNDLENSLEIFCNNNTIKEIGQNSLTLIAYMVAKKCIITESAKKNYNAQIEKKLSEDLSPNMKLLIERHLECFNENYLKTNRYTHNLLDLAYDEKFDSEVCGFANHARNKCIVFDLSDSLDLILSETFHVDRKVVREKLDNYELVSRAILTQDEYLLKKLDVKLSNFYGLGEKLDEFINYSSKCNKDSIRNIIGEPIDLTEYAISKSQRMMIIFYAVVLTYAYNLTLKVMCNYFDYLQSKYGRDVLMTSKGISRFVIQSNVEIQENIFLEMSHNSALIKPWCLGKGEYLDKIGGGMICYL